MTTTPYELALLRLEALRSVVLRGARHIRVVPEGEECENAITDIEALDFKAFTASEVCALYALFGVCLQEGGLQAFAEVVNILDVLERIKAGVKEE